MSELSDFEKLSFDPLLMQQYVSMLREESYQVYLASITSGPNQEDYLKRAAELSESAGELFITSGLAYSQGHAAKAYAWAGEYRLQAGQPLLAQQDYQEAYSLYQSEMHANLTWGTQRSLFKTILRLAQIEFQNKDYLPCLAHALEAFDLTQQFPDIPRPYELSELLTQVELLTL